MTKDHDAEKAGLPRALNEGDAVILSTGATAIVRRSYPAGYNGDVDILLDGAEEADRADALILSDEVPAVAESQLSAGRIAHNDAGETRGPNRRMED